jgi:hypothetical protein
MTTKVYLRVGRVTHLLPESASPNSYAKALCGWSPAWPDMWRGTGSYEEQESASRMPTCIRCAAALLRAIDNRPW